MVNNFIEYIASEQIFQLPFDIIVSIFINFQQKQQEMENEKIITDFVFSCINKFGDDALPMLEYLDYNHHREDIYNRII